MFDRASIIPRAVVSFMMLKATLFVNANVITALAFLSFEFHTSSAAFSISTGTNLQFSETATVLLQYCYSVATALLQCRLLRRVSGSTVSSSPANCTI
ncbi:hypothetical protein LXL04_005870 [Taraxacum kok-saghyz]